MIKDLLLFLTGFLYCCSNDWVRLPKLLILRSFIYGLFCSSTRSIVLFRVLTTFVPGENVLELGCGMVRKYFCVEIHVLFVLSS